MDTRFWGPSGWKLLHLITFSYKFSEKCAKNFAQFFETLPYILPCKFCRASLTDYYRKYPFLIKNTLDPKLNLKRWMYDIHNCVNDKLRRQGLNPNSDPKFVDVQKFYEKWEKCDWQQQLQTIWDFLFAVAYNHPKESTHFSTPMPDCPKDVYKCKDACEKNKWNILPLKERIRWFRRFWLYLPAVLPLGIAEKWNAAAKHNPAILDCRRSTLAWLWRMRCSLDSDFKDPYTSICKKIGAYSSDCGKKKGAITCRKMRSNAISKTIRKCATLKNKK